MAKYEYKVVVGSAVTRNSPDLDKQLTALGSDGWKLVSVSQLTLPKEQWCILYVFERPTGIAPK